ncbi:unnamed protein product [Closterium sp. NIES-65]|nr:unnamed protein product [Closterium sp. NIES-65]
MAGDEMAGDEMAGDEMAGGEMAGDEMAGDEMAGDEMAAGEMAAGEMAAGEMAAERPIKRGLDQNTLPGGIPARALKDLSAVDRTKTPWLVVSLHEPWYHSNSDHQTDGQDMRKALEETLYAARVDILITGHVHAYERTTRVYNGQEDPCGIMHITVGSGGKDLYPRYVSFSID